MTIEEWRIISGFQYEVSSLGNVRRIGGKNLAMKMQRNGYCRVSLGARNDRLVHRLVAQAFHGNPPGIDSHADHINSKRSDNRSTNIRWLSPQENRRLRNVAKGEQSGMSKLTHSQVLDIRASCLSKNDLYKQYDCSPRTIRDVLNNVTWRHAL